MSSETDKNKAKTESFNSSLIEIRFTDEQRRALEAATGLAGLTGVRLVDLDSASRAKLSPGLVRATAVVMCW